MPVDATIGTLFAHYGRGRESVSDRPSTRSIILPSTQVQSLATSAGFRRVTAEISKFMPEREEGENIARVKAVAGGDPVELKKQEIQLFVYQLSNNLIQVEQDVNVEEDRFRRIVGLFHKLDLPLVAWKRYFVQSRGEATSSAFVEKLFEAAVNTRELGLCEALLESGADPDKAICSAESAALIYSAGKTVLVRPIQHSVERGVRDAALVKLLIRFGAGVDLTTKTDDWPAILKAAKNGITEAVRALVEAGADIRAAYTGLRRRSWITHDTALSQAADSKHYRHGRKEYDTDGCGQLKGYSCLKYLLPLYDPERDREIIQSALLVAARRHRTDMIPLLLGAGADINGTNVKGYTPLIAAVNACKDGKGVPAVQLLLDLGADPDGTSGHASPSALRPLHLAAALGESELVALLIERGADVDSLAFTGKENYRDITADLYMETSRPTTPLLLALSSSRLRNPGLGADQAAVAFCLLRAGAGLIGGELVHAAGLNSVELVCELLDREADINETDKGGKSALQKSICFLSPCQIAEVLIEAGAEMRGGELMSAVRVGSRGIVDALLRSGASMSRETGTKSVLAAAADSCNWDLMTWLMEAHSVPYEPAALCAAVCSERSNEKCLETLLQRRDPAKVGGLLTATAVGYAAHLGETEMLDRLLEFKNQNTCLLPVTDDTFGYITLAEEDWGCMSDAYYRSFWRGKGHIRCSVLVPALLATDWDAVRQLLDAGHWPDRLALYVAVVRASSRRFEQYFTPEEVHEHKTESIVMIRRLTGLMSPKDITQRARRKLGTPLQTAARVRRPDVARHLLSAGADVNAPPPQIIYYAADEVVPPRTALQWAVENGDVEMTELLLEAGADASAPAGHDSGATALQLAAGNGHLGIARRLMGLGADVNAAGAKRRGRTALQAAAEGGRLDMVEFLLECGAGRLGDGGVLSRAGYAQARRLARKNGHMAVEALLEAHEKKWVDVGDTHKVYEEPTAAAAAVVGAGGGEESNSDSSTSSARSVTSDDESGYYSPEEGNGEEGDDEGYEEDPEEMY